jgi:Subtilisin inhibitor-like
VSMRAVLTLAITCVVLVACSAASGGSTSGTSLRIAFWEDGTGVKPDAVWTLRCNPAGGSLAQPARACRRLEAGGPELFVPLPKNIVCTEIYGGPQRARVVGRVNGRRIWATFTRTNGCNIDRWQRLSPWLLPPGGIT